MIQVKEIINYLEGRKYSFTAHGNSQLEIGNYCNLSDSQRDCVIWVKKEENLTEEIRTLITSDLIISCLLTEESISFLCSKDCLLLICDYPKTMFFDLVEHFFVEKIPACIQETSVVETDCIGNNVTIGYFCHIGKNVEICNDVVIGDNVSITCPATIGDRTVINSGVVIGTDGYGYYEGLDGKQHQVPHTGGVEIGCDVSVGANTCIDRGTIGNTIIEDRVKIDNLCHIAHNVRVCADSMVVAQALLGGSSIIKNNAYIAPCAAVMNQVTVGEHALVGMGAVVTKDVSNNKVVAGVPAKVLRDNV